MNTLFIYHDPAHAPFWKAWLFYTSPAAIQLVESATFGCN